MHTLRTYISWLFAFTALVCLQVGASLTVTAIRAQYSSHTVYGSSSRLLLFIAPLMMLAFAIVFSFAWWTVFKQKPSARIWGIVASLINIQVGIIPVLLPPHSLMSFSYLLVGLGITGLVAFGRRIHQSDPLLTTGVRPRIPGDGTSTFLNQSGQVLFLVVGAAAYYWWLGWVRARDLPVLDSSWKEFVAATIIGLIIATLHELGHTLVGLALGMKLRAFIVGPFQWQIRDGKWEFEFKPSQILIGGGKTGVVPARPDFPRWAQLCMSSAGVFVNVVTGILAFGAVSLAQATELGGLLGLFGSWSLVLGAINLVPFRTGNNYSDGAQIYQLLSNGPWSDLHRAFTVAGSTLVTPLRPRDYDIASIRRAERTINQGFQGLVLRLLAYNHFLDLNRFAEAADAIGEAGMIYNQSASDAPAELLTPFVFGSAYISRNADVARQWWVHLEAKKPTRFNADYWLAASALAWMEGRFKDANQHWDKANTLAEGLPRFGAYEFDRHCCRLLRQALDEVPATA